MRLCAYAGWSESGHSPIVGVHFFTWCGPYVTYIVSAWGMMFDIHKIKFTSLPTPQNGCTEHLSCSLLIWKLQTGRENNQGPVVQSVVSLTSSYRVISLTVLADSIYNILIFFAEKKMWVAFALQKLLTFLQQKNSAYLRITRCKF